MKVTDKATDNSVGWQGMAEYHFRQAVSREEAEAILAARALALAEEPGDDRETAGLEVLEFRLGFETYGIESAFVQEVYPLKDFTPLPCTPSFVLGITS